MFQADNIFAPLRFLMRSVQHQRSLLKYSIYAIGCVAVVLFFRLFDNVTVGHEGNSSGAQLVVEPGQSDTSVAAKGSITSYATELARVDQDLQAKIALAAERPDSWLRLEWVANAHIARARLTGEFDDYVAAQTALQKAFALAGDGGGPVLSRATLNFTLHRLPAVESDLVQAESALLIDKPTVAFINGMRADVLFQTARYSEAKSAYDKLDKSNPSSASAARLAHYYAHTGDHQKAEQWFAKAEKRVVGRSSHLRSWLKLQLGILDFERGRWNEALAHYRDALEVFPGFWLVEEHIAEIDALQGRSRQAEKKYRDLIVRTNSPMFMAELAGILQERNEAAEKDEAAIWMAKASRTFATMMEQIPEVMSGHALEHFLQFGDSVRTLQMAQDNYRLRPGGRAALLLVQAHTALGQLSQALPVLEKLLATPYRSADLHATAGVIFRAEGQAHRADQQDTKARAINPFAVDEVAWLRDKLTTVSAKSAVH